MQRSTRKSWSSSASRRGRGGYLEKLRQEQMFEGVDEDYDTADGEEEGDEEDEDLIEL